MQKITCVLAILLLSVSTTCLFAQGDKKDGYKEQTYDTADLEYIPLLIKTPSYLPRHMHTGSTPFCQVRVLDNRFDTVVLCSKGYWPHRPKRYTLGRSTRAVIQQYLEQEIASMKKTGSKTLLLNITQLGLAHTINPAYNTSSLVATRDMTHFLFTADAYYQTGKDSWRKIVTIHYPSRDTMDQGAQIKWLLSRALDASGSIGRQVVPRPRGVETRSWTRNEKKYFVYSKDTAIFSLDDINKPVTMKWKEYPVLAKPQVTAGYYRTFADFREGRLIKDTIQVFFNDKDSIYSINEGPWMPKRKHQPQPQIADSLSKHPHLPWAVVESGHLYLSLDNNRFLELNHCGNTFFFYIPRSMDDGYALLTKPVDEYVPELGQGLSFDGTNGNILAAVGASLLLGGTLNLIDYWAHSAHAACHPPKKASDPDYGFRTCYIDMDIGNIVY